MRWRANADRRPANWRARSIRKAPRLKRKSASATSGSPDWKISLACFGTRSRLGKKLSEFCRNAGTAVMQLDRELDAKLAALEPSERLVRLCACVLHGSEAV